MCRGIRLRLLARSLAPIQCLIQTSGLLSATPCTHRSLVFALAFGSLHEAAQSPPARYRHTVRHMVGAEDKLMKEATLLLARRLELWPGDRPTVDSPQGASLAEGDTEAALA